jgi:hypothetical protein
LLGEEARKLSILSDNHFPYIMGKRVFWGFFRESNPNGNTDVSAPISRRLGDCGEMRNGLSANETTTGVQFWTGV